MSECDDTIFGCADRDGCPICSTATYLGRVRCLGEKNVLVRNGFTRWVDIDHLNEIKAGRSEFLNPPEYYEVRQDLPYSDDELRAAIDQPFIEPLDVTGFDWKSKSPFKTNPRSQRDLMRDLLARRIKQQAKIRATLIGGGRKPCRYKVCGGVVHEGKCPVSQARGSTGGSKKGASKARMGASNGSTKAPRPCCGTLRSKPHAIDCDHAIIANRKDADRLKILRAGRAEALTPERIEIEWVGFTVPVHVFGRAMMRNINGTCGGCEWTGPALKAERIHRADCVADTKDARLICGGCV